MRLTYSPNYIRMSGTTDELSRLKCTLVGLGDLCYEPLWEGNLLPSGLIGMAIRNAAYLGIPTEVKGCPTSKKEVPLKTTRLGDKELRPYQQVAISRMIAYRRGLIVLGTGGGKTEVYLGFLAFQKHKGSLMLVPSDDARTQTVQRGKGLGLDIRILDKQPEAGADYVTTPNYVYRNLHRLSSFLRQISCLCVDEAHHLGTSPTYQEIAKRCTAPYRFGLTATPFTDQGNPHRLLEDLLLLGWLGYPLIDLPVGKLAEMDIVETPKVFCVYHDAPLVPDYSVSVPDPEHPKDRTKDKVNWFLLRRAGLTSNEYRNKLLLDMFVRIIEQGRKPLMLIDLVKQGKDLFHQAAARGLDVALCKGGRETWMSHNVVSRRVSRRDFNEKFDEVQGVIGTSVFDEVIDLPGFTDLVLGAGGKGGKGRYTKTIQRVGRSLRKSGSEHQVRVFLPIDRHHSVLLWHSICQRRAIEAQGFKTVNIKVGYGESNRLSVLPESSTGDGGASPSKPGYVAPPTWGT